MNGTHCRHWLFQNTDSPTFNQFAYCAIFIDDVSVANTIPDLMTCMRNQATTAKLAFTLQARLYSLQADPATYCNEPDGKSLALSRAFLWDGFYSLCPLCPGPPEQFENWLFTFRLEEMKGEISELMVNSPSIRALYTKMVSFVALTQLILIWQTPFYQVIVKKQNILIFFPH